MTAIQKDADGNVIEPGTKTDEEVIAEGGTIETAPEVNDDEVIDDEVDKPLLSDSDQMRKDLAEKSRRHPKEEPTDDNPDNPGELDPEAAEVAADEEMVTLKVNGQDIQKTQAEVDAAGGVAAIQKSLAGDMKLAQAAEEKKKLEQDREEIREVIGENKQLKGQIAELTELLKQQKAAPEATPASKEEIAAKAKQITEKFFHGDAEELQVAVEEILLSANASVPAPAAPAPAPPVDEAAIARRVQQSIDFKAEQKEAISDFEKNHADLNTDGRRKYVNDLTIAIGKDNPDWGPKKIITEAVTQTRKDLNLPVPAAAPKKDPVQDLDSKRNKKQAAADAIPVASQRRTVPAKSNKPKTGREIFEEIESKRSH
jgi:hypothetical protein